MSRKCEKCEKTTVFGNRISHSNRKTRRTWKVNVFKLKVNVNSVIKKLLLCSRCIRTKGVITKKSFL